MTTDAGAVADDELAGGGPAAGGAAAGAIAAPSVDPLTGLPAAPAAPAATAPAARDALPEWAAALPDDAPDDKTPSDRAWAKIKGFAAPGDLVKSYRELERALGNDKVPLPKTADDKAGWDRVWKALGRPDAPDKYDLPVPDGGDKAFAGEFAAKAFELGMPAAMAKGAVDWWNGKMAAVAKDQETAEAARLTTETAALRSELGVQFDATRELAWRAAERFGFADEVTVKAMRSALGPKALVTKLAAIGKAMGEDSMAGGGQRPTGLTPEGAATRKAEIMRDKDFQARLRDKDSAATAEWAEIARIEAIELERRNAA